MNFGKNNGLDWANSNYYVPAGNLGFSVAVFVICAVLCILTLLVRRKLVGGELGGSEAGRTGSAVLLIGLWFVYVILSILQVYAGEGSFLAGLTMGITQVGSPNCNCYVLPAEIAKCQAA